AGPVAQTVEAAVRQNRPNQGQTHWPRLSRPGPGSRLLLVDAAQTGPLLRSWQASPATLLIAPIKFGRAFFGGTAQHPNCPWEGERGGRQEEEEEEEEEEEG
ncbi:unnamed protein product, partial [Prorocentrum cordatum]